MKSLTRPLLPGRRTGFSRFMRKHPLLTLPANDTDPTVSYAPHPRLSARDPEDKTNEENPAAMDPDHPNSVAGEELGITAENERRSATWHSWRPISTSQWVPVTRGHRHPGR